MSQLLKLLPVVSLFSLTAEAQQAEEPALLNDGFRVPVVGMEITDPCSTHYVRVTYTVSDDGSITDATPVFTWPDNSHRDLGKRVIESMDMSPLVIDGVPTVSANNVQTVVFAGSGECETAREPRAVFALARWCHPAGEQAASTLQFLPNGEILAAGPYADIARSWQYDEQAGRLHLYLDWPDRFPESAFQTYVERGDIADYSVTEKRLSYDVVNGTDELGILGNNFFSDSKKHRDQFWWASCPEPTNPADTP